MAHLMKFMVLGQWQWLELRFGVVGFCFEDEGED